MIDQVTLPNKVLWAWQAAYGADAEYRWMERRIDIDRWEKAAVLRRASTLAFSFSVPTDAALDLIAKYGPIIEIGAGTGYWAALLRNRGVDLRAFDTFPASLDEDDNHWYKNTESFTDVERADETVVSQFADRALMLAWPPYGDPMGARTLELYQGNTLIYIGEGEGGCCADDDFFARLEAEWVEVEDLLLPQWDGINDWLTVYRRLA